MSKLASNSPKTSLKALSKISKPFRLSFIRPTNKIIGLSSNPYFTLKSLKNIFLIFKLFKTPGYIVSTTLELIS